MPRSLKKSKKNTKSSIKISKLSTKKKVTLRLLHVVDLKKSPRVYVYDLGQNDYNEKKDPLKIKVTIPYREPDALLEFDGHLYNGNCKLIKKNWHYKSGPYTSTAPSSTLYYVKAKVIYNRTSVPDIDRFQICSNPFNVISYDCLDGVNLWIRA